MSQTKPFHLLVGCALFALGSLLVACQSEIQSGGVTTASSSSDTTTGTVEQGTVSSPASVADVLAGLQYWDSTGTLQTGTMSSSALNLQNTFPGAGYYSSANNAPTASEIASGSTILGIAGSADFGSFTGSSAYRTVGDSQITLQQEVTTTLAAEALHAPGRLPRDSRYHEG